MSDVFCVPVVAWMAMSSLTVIVAGAATVVALRLAAQHVKPDVRAEACGCTDGDPARCGEDAVKRLRLGVVGFCHCCRCHPPDESEAGGAP